MSFASLKDAVLPITWIIFSYVIAWPLNADENRWVLWKALLRFHTTSLKSADIFSTFFAGKLRLYCISQNIFKNEQSSKTTVRVSLPQVVLTKNPLKTQRPFKSNNILLRSQTVFEFFWLIPLRIQHEVNLPQKDARTLLLIINHEIQHKFSSMHEFYHYAYRNYILATKTLFKNFALVFLILGMLIGWIYSG